MYIHSKCLCKGTVMWNIEVLALTVKKVIRNIKVSDRITEWQTGQK